jgi:hypothetical protein
VLVAVRGQQGKLLSADPGRHVEAPLRDTEGARHPPQLGVSRAVAVLVVQALETVEVAQHEAERRVAALGALEPDVEDLLEAAPVQQLG